MNSPDGPHSRLLDFAYIIAIVFFILSLKWLSSPATARRGVLVGEIGAALAVLPPSSTPNWSSTSGC